MPLLAKELAAKKINPLLRGSAPGLRSLTSGCATSSFWCMGFSWHLFSSTGVSSWLLLHPGRVTFLSVFLSAFSAADLLILAVHTEIQTALFLFRYFCVASSSFLATAGLRCHC